MSLSSSDTDSVRLGGLLSGVLVTQIVNSAVHLAQPLLVADMSGSLGNAAFFSAFGTGVHMLGTYLAGWPTDRFGARLVLVFSTLLRGVVLAGIPIAMAFGVASLPWVMVCYTLEALIRGYVDTSVHTVPLDLVGHRRNLLDRINSRYEVAFEVGAVAGPLMLGGLMLWSDGIVPHIVIPIGFVASAVCYLFIPKTTLTGHLDNPSSHGGSWSGLKYILAHRYLLIVVAALMLFHLYELRKLLSAFFAKGLLHHPAAVGHVGSAFALGGVAGALLYAVTRHRGSGMGWVLGGAAGTLVLAVGWIPVNLPVMMVAVFLFGVSNVCARLVLTRWRQELTPLEFAGGVTAASEFGRTAISVGINSVVGAAFSSGGSVYSGFGIVGGMLGLFAVAQVVLVRLLGRRHR
ncbi:MFS transporter [Mycobacterium sp. DL592]|uniref:MFS transporter n=1 Tax=Mycobacterium sp. DL592 TaxID=2675524 RepID=UPI00141E9171|nr:MFS transporter [Mycobacterium sp. DL592]